MYYGLQIEPKSESSNRGYGTRGRVNYGPMVFAPDPPLSGGIDRQASILFPISYKHVCR